MHLQASDLTPMIRSLGFALWILVAAVPVSAQDVTRGNVVNAPVPGGASDVENVIITGRRPDGMTVKDYMLDFITGIGDPASDDNGYARWREHVCVSVRSLRDVNAAQYVVDRVSAIALEVGLKPGEPGCRPNLVIFFTNDGPGLAKQLVTASPRAFRPFGGTGGTTQGYQALAQFTTSDAPVRWWQITMMVDQNGQMAVATADGIVPYIAGSNSRITNSVSDELWATYVIVDGTKLGEVHWSQLADYLAMVSLAKVNPTGVPASHNSILNLFRGGSPATGLTDMDRSYLRALYTMDTRRMPRMQRSLLASTMVRRQDDMAEEEQGRE